MIDAGRCVIIGYRVHCGCGCGCARYEVWWHDSIEPLWLDFQARISEHGWEIASHKPRWRCRQCAACEPIALPAAIAPDWLLALRSSDDVRRDHCRIDEDQTRGVDDRERARAD